ncbi:MAG: DUF2335 domain-containing protein [Bacteroidales bacterium]|nr:DUF2335 domain-containing protein [Bacteroidales bacterium]
MSKKVLQQRTTKLANSDGATGNQLEQTFSVDDSFLPSPTELSEYKQIDPQIVDLLCRMSENEQKSRHKIEKEKLRIMYKAETRQYRINVWGMLFAFLALLVMMGVTAWALYLDRAWIATLFGVLSATTIIGLFMTPKSLQKDSDKPHDKPSNN